MINYNSRITIWIVDPFTQVKSAEYRIQHKIDFKLGHIL